MLADAFAGYDRLFSPEREGGPLTEAACWAHARRKIHDVVYKHSHSDSRRSPETYR
ncbi:IS66 family transposase [Klebsiella pneumoniae]|uniref:IS66 family transposase n=1 Tax=Klebsiella pneumoniae TaxID=573 RepID=UPI00226B5CF7|nr:transposase [Klebsiella pneumoniae]